MRRSALLGMLLLLSVFPYIPGLYGGFFLDDFPNLSGLEAINEGASGLLQYILSAPSGGSGRSLAYLSFGLQAGAWPDHPEYFRFVNYIIHLVNAVLAFLLFRRLLEADRTFGSGVYGFAVILAVLWSINPIHVNAVQYIVQRMTLLAGTFSLASVYLFVLSGSRGRNIRQGLVFLVLSAVMVLIGIFAKESTVTVLPLIGVTYLFIRKSPGWQDSFWARWYVAGGVAGFLGLMIYLVARGELVGYAIRSFNLCDRLITEPVVMFDYVRKIILPGLRDFSLFNDGYPILYCEESSFAQYLPLLALLLITFASLRFLGHARLRWFAFGWLWFVAGHLLESTILPLEIYFEHRNYIPSVGLIFGFVVGSAQVLLAGMQVDRRIGAGILCLVGVYWGWVSYVESVSWGSDLKMASDSLFKRPHSLRAYQNMSSYYARQGDYLSAYLVLDNMRHKEPELVSPGVIVQIQLLSCLIPGPAVRLSDFDRNQLGIRRFDQSTDTIGDLINIKANGQCDRIGWPVINDTIQAILENDAYDRVRVSLRQLQAYAYFLQGLKDKAIGISASIPDNDKSLEFLVFEAALRDEAGDTMGARQIMKEIRQRGAKSLIRLQGNDLYLRLVKKYE
ncbi:hypothetical protein AAIA72_06095 [Hahella sp. SMD15-11]|uniref:Glycosyltransferase RgtA/B/C/D-like domain-containing protein n=1 Tax=Thermohahella caldifontis TaxID=3142973 RepID=A0AB39UYX1_9GAMM